MDILPIEITKSEDVLFVKSQLSIFSDYFLEIIKIYNLTIEKNNDIALKLAKLKEKYNDLTKNNTNKVFLFCLNSLYFQYKILNFELENFNKLNSLIQNRMYGDYYKLYNIIINQCKENNILFSDEDFVEINNKIDSLEASEICEEDNIPPSPLSVNAMDTACNDNQNDQEKRNISDNNFPIYKDIDPFFRYKIEDVISLHQRILIIVDKLDNIYIGGYFFPVSVYNSMGWSILKNNNGEELSQIINTIIIDPNTNNPIFGGIIGNFGTITNVFNVIKFDLSNNTWFPLNNSNGFGLNAQCNVLVYDKYNNRIIAGGLFSGLTDGTTSNNTLSLIASYDGTNWSPISNGINGSYVQTIGILNKGTTLIGGFINGSKNIYSNGLVIYTNNYVNIWWKKNLLYTLTDFNNKVTISARDIVQYVFEHSL